MNQNASELTQTPQGVVPQGEGWFIVNFADARGMSSERFGGAVRFEGEPEFDAFGLNVRILQPGQPNCLYHRESQTEAFLVLEGECVAIVEEQERPMRRGDFLSAPPGTAHREVRSRREQLHMGGFAYSRSTASEPTHTLCERLKTSGPP